MSFPIKGDNDRFDSYEEFLDNISRGGEVEFYYQNTKYTLTHGKDNDGCRLVYFGVANSDEICECRIENDNFDFVGDFVLDGQKLRQIVCDFNVVFRCF